jgi:hypothetical protein
VRVEVETTPEFWLSVAFVTTENEYEVPGVRPVIVSEVSFAPGWLVIVQLGVHVTV